MSAYTADQKASAKLLSLIADDEDEVTAGKVTKTTSSTTAVVTHGLGGTPDFILATTQSDYGNLAVASPVANTTTVTFTIATAQTAWSVCYILGYTA